MAGCNSGSMKIATNYQISVPSASGRRHPCFRDWYLLAAVVTCCPLLLSASSWWFWKTKGETIKSSSSNHTNTMATTASITPNASEPASDPCAGKEHLLKIAKTIGIDLKKETTRRTTCSMMPLWSEVTRLYGDKPRIIGLETCQQYRDLLTEANKTLADPVYAMPRVGGLHNSGTNALADTFFDNMTPNPSIRSKNPRVYNVPWRKHTPLEYRFNVTAQFYHWHEDKNHVLPVIVIRDPYRWMASMCKVSYNVHWAKASKHCPNLVWYPRKESNFTLNPVNVSLELKEPTLTTSVKWKSLAHMWSDWNLQYLKADFPRLIVRYEDTLYHSKQVFQAISDCAGVSLKHQNFQPFTLKANSNSSASNYLISALAKNGDRKDRFSRMIAEDIEYAKAHLDPVLMKLFHYVNIEGIPPDSYAAYDLAQRDGR